MLHTISLLLYLILCSCRENRSVHPFDTEMFVRARDRSLVPLVLVRHPEDHIKLLFIYAKSILE